MAMSMFGRSAARSEGSGASSKVTPNGDVYLIVSSILPRWCQIPGTESGKTFPAWGVSKKLGDPKY